jgi:hypothetical protein
LIQERHSKVAQKHQFKLPSQMEEIKGTGSHIVLEDLRSSVNNSHGQLE